jgi:hypothetical protein
MLDDIGLATPVLFIIFNRPDIAKKSFLKIRDARPSRLYIACDGPRNTNEQNIVELTRKTIQELIDWECDVHYLFQEKNLGCSMGVYTAISWFFEHEECGIILEDDCKVNASLFPFMEELLERYKDDQRIGMIAGTNTCLIQTETSYYFSRYKACWGWATWKRSWKNMDLPMRWRKTDHYMSILRNMGYRGCDINYWKYRLKLIDNNQVSAWDWQWYFTLAAQNQLSIFPKINLVSNIGFGENATHTTNKKQPKEYLAHMELDFPLMHPEYVIPNDSFDKCYYRNNNSFYYTLMRFIPFKIKKIIKNIIR